MFFFRFFIDFIYRTVYIFLMSQESTKNQILEISTALFAEKGYDAVGVQEIVDKSGITKPTLYYYFGSKKGLLESIVLEKETEHLSLLEKSAEYKHLFFESLTEILQAEIDFASKNPEYFRFRINLLNSGEQSEAYGVFHPYSVQLDEMMLEFFKLSTAEFGNMRDKEELYSSLFSANICSIAMKAASGQIKIDEKVLYTIIHSFVYGFAD